MESLFIMKASSSYQLVFYSFVVSTLAVKPIVATSSFQIETEDDVQPEQKAELRTNVDTVYAIDDSSIIEPNVAFGKPFKAKPNTSIPDSQTPSNFNNKTLDNVSNNTTMNKFYNFSLENMLSLSQNLANMIKRNHFFMTLVLSQLKRTVSQMSSTDFIELSKQLISAYENMNSSSEPLSIKILPNSNNSNITNLSETLYYNSTANNLHLLDLHIKKPTDDSQQQVNYYDNTSSINHDDSYGHMNGGESNFNTGLRLETPTSGRQVNYYDDPSYIDRGDSYGYMSGGGSYGGGGLDPYTLLAALGSAAFLAATAWKFVHWKTKKKRSLTNEHEFDQYDIEELLAMVWTALENIH